jgi:hypothetical protein
MFVSFYSLRCSCFFASSPFKINVCVFSSTHLALTPIWLEMWVFSACGAESACMKYDSYKQFSFSPFPCIPLGGRGGGGLYEFGGVWGGGRTSPIPYIPHRILTLEVHKNSPCVLSYLQRISPLPQYIYFLGTSSTLTIPTLIFSNSQFSYTENIMSKKQVLSYSLILT